METPFPAALALPALDAAAVTGPRFIAALGVSSAALVFGAAIAVRWVLAADPRRRRLQVIVAAATFLLTLGARLTLMAGKVSWAPYLDQFDGELASVLKPFLDGALVWSDLAAAHNDHRIATTRFASLAAFVVNGEWDNRVLAIAGCVVQAASLAWLAAFALRELRGREAALVIAMALLPMGLAHDWENLVSGFQLGFHLLVLFTLIALTLVPNAAPGSGASWVGVASALLAAASMASGLASIVAVLLGLALNAWVAHRSTRASAVLFVGLAGAAWIYWHTRVVSGPDPMHAQDLAQWLGAVWSYGAWPLMPNAACFALLWLPWAALVVHALVRREAAPFSVFVICAGAWLLAQVLSLAWGRASFAPLVGSRYTGLLHWVPVVSTASVVLLARGRAKPFVSWALVVIVFGFFAWQQQHVHGQHFANFVTLQPEHEVRLRAFMRHDDPRVFEQVDFPLTPHPDAERIVSLLRDPRVRGALPVLLRREDLRLADPVAAKALEAGPLTLVARSLLRSGPAALAAGAVLLAWALFVAHRSRSSRSAVDQRG